ncbi:MAG: hypothetical protein WCU00_10860 [Candidatus Latescibacterota bacterium]
MNKNILITAIAAFCLILPIRTSFLYAQAASGPRVEIAITDNLVLKQGETRTAQRDSTGALLTHPGDVIQYTLTAVNRGTQPAHEAEMIDPVPKGTEYVPGSAFGEGMTITYSIDGGKFYQPQPITYDFRKSDGAVEKRPALPGMYTHIKWLVNKPILPGTRVSASFRVKVID